MLRRFDLVEGARGYGVPAPVLCSVAYTGGHAYVGTVRITMCPDALYGTTGLWYLPAQFMRGRVHQDHVPSNKSAASV